MSRTFIHLLTDPPVPPVPPPGLGRGPAHQVGGEGGVGGMGGKKGWSGIVQSEAGRAGIYPGG